MKLVAVEFIDGVHNFPGWFRVTCTECGISLAVPSHEYELGARYVCEDDSE